MASSPRRASRPTLSRSSSGSRLRGVSSVDFLFLEDEAPIVDALARWLRRRFGERVRVERAGTVEEGKDVLARAADAQLRHTALFVDLGLPDGCGLDFLETARRLDPSVPAFVITARKMRADWVLRMAMLGVERYDKPIPPELAVVLAERAIARRADQAGKLITAIESLGLTDAVTRDVHALARGKKVSEIAEETGRDESTIQNQLASAFWEACRSLTSSFVVTNY